MPIERVALVQQQRTTDISYEAKAVRLDVYVADGTGMVYDIEMQRLNATNLPRRARYYQSLLDSEQLDKGADYNDLPDTFVIFFCTFDPFRKGFRRYTFKQTCQEDSSIEVEDGTTRMFLNSSAEKGKCRKTSRSFCCISTAGIIAITALLEISMQASSAFLHQMS